MKYIIKNCPAKFYSEIDDEQKCWQKWEEKSEYCKDCPDCIIKRIVELCRDEMRFDRKSDLSLATDIMSFLEIEEVNE